MVNARFESLTTTAISVFSHGKKIGRASGFVYRFGQHVSLVSNWHVFSGRDANNPRKILNRDGHIPDHVEFHVAVTKHKISTRSNNFESRLLRLCPVSLPLTRDGACLWRRHIGYTTATGTLDIVDIGTLPLEEYLHLNNLASEDLCALTADVVMVTDPETGTSEVSGLYPRVSDDVFLVGYPHGLQRQGVFPIWKKGSIASEPLVLLDGGIPAYYVDSLTRSGMSGAPVLSFSTLTDYTGIINSGESNPNRAVLLGVYAGRDGATDDENTIALGRVWRRDLLDEIFFRSIPGNEGFNE